MRALTRTTQRAVLLLAHGRQGARGRLTSSGPEGGGGKKPPSPSIFERATQAAQAAATSAGNGVKDSITWATGKEGRAEAAKASKTVYSTLSGGVQAVSDAIKKQQASSFGMSGVASSASAAAAKAAQDVVSNATSTVSSSFWAMSGKLAGFAIVLVAVGGFAYGLGSAAPRLVFELVRGATWPLRRKRSRDEDGDEERGEDDRAGERARQAASKAREAATEAWEKAKDRTSEGAREAAAEARRKAGEAGRRGWAALKGFVRRDEPGSE